MSSNKSPAFGSNKSLPAARMGRLKCKEPGGAPSTLIPTQPGTEGREDKDNQGTCKVLFVKFCHCLFTCTSTRTSLPIWALMRKPNVALIVQFLFPVSCHFSDTSKFYQPVLVPPRTLITFPWGYEMVPSGLLYSSSMGGGGGFGNPSFFFWINSHIEGSIKHPLKDFKPTVHRLDPSGLHAHAPILCEQRITLHSTEIVNMHDFLKPAPLRKYEVCCTQLTAS